MKKKVVVLVTFLGLLVACTPIYTTELSTTTKTHTQSPSQTIAPRPSQAPIQALRSTITPPLDALPTLSTGQLTPGFKQTQIATGTVAAATRIANREATARAKLLNEVMTATPPEIIESHLSPDRKWRVESVQYGCVDIGADEGVKNSYEQLRLVNIKDGKETIITDQLQYCDGIGAAGLGFVYWSPNSQYIYYTDSAYGVPDGGNRAWYPSLFRYDTGNGNTIDLRWGPLSPDGVTMAYPDQQKLVLYLWNLDEGEVARIPSSFSPDSPWPGIFDIAWSPDGRYLVYIEAENSEGIGKAWITQLDTATFERKAIYQTESGQLCCLEWQTQGQIQFRQNNEVNTLIVPPMTFNGSPTPTATSTP